VSEGKRSAQAEGDQAGTGETRRGSSASAPRAPGRRPAPIDADFHSFIAPPVHRVKLRKVLVLIAFFAEFERCVAAFKSVDRVEGRAYRYPRVG
jgi:hypothetical protein